MGEISDTYIREAVFYPSKSNAPTRLGRRLPLALIAAMMALLVGCTVAIAVYGDSIQNWFRHQWETITGQSMSEEQIAVIDHLSQKIGESQTIGDVTVTVDSATVGDDTFFLLLRVEGLSFSDKHSYEFDKISMRLEPDPLDHNGGIGGYGFEYQGLDGDGAVLLLMDYRYAGADHHVKDSDPLRVILYLQDFVQDAHTDKQKVMAEGIWNYTFTLDRTHLPVAISLPDTKTMVMDRLANEEVPIMLTNIELTNTGIRFQLDHHGNDREDSLNFADRLSAVLENGAVIRNSGGVGSSLEDGSALRYSYQWQIPLNLDEVRAIQIGSAQISVP